MNIHELEEKLLELLPQYIDECVEAGLDPDEATGELMDKAFNIADSQ